MVEPPWRVPLVTIINECAGDALQIKAFIRVERTVFGRHNRVADVVRQPLARDDFTILFRVGADRGGAVRVIHGGFLGQRELFGLRASVVVYRYANTAIPAQQAPVQSREKKMPSTHSVHGACLFLCSFSSCSGLDGYWKPCGLRGGNGSPGAYRGPPVRSGRLCFARCAVASERGHCLPNVHDEYKKPWCPPLTVGLEQSFDVSVNHTHLCRYFFRNSYNWARFLILHEYCLNALVGLPCDPARTFSCRCAGPYVSIDLSPASTRRYVTQLPQGRECSKGKWPLTGCVGGFLYVRIWL